MPHCPRFRLPTTTLLLGLALPLAHAATDSPHPDEPPAVVVITAARGGQLAVDAPASMSVVSRRDIEIRGADDVLEAVRLETGVSLQGRAVGGRKVLSLRGLESRHTLFLVDGQRTSASDGVVGASDFQYDWLATVDIDRIEVVRGPLSVLYGSEALGGVINVITREPGATWRARTLAEGSQAVGHRGGDGWRAGAGIDGPLGGGFVLQASAAASHVQPLASPAEPRLSELEGRDKQSGWLGLGWREGAHRVRLDVRDEREEREAGARERSGARRWHITYNDIERESIGAGWQADWETRNGPGMAAAGPKGEALQTELRAYRTRMSVVNRRTEGVAVNPTQVLTDSVVDGQARLARADGDAHGWLLGFELRQEALDDPGLPGGHSQVEHRSLFVQDEWRLGPTLTLTAGVRQDQHSVLGGHTSPRLYAVWHAGGGWTVKGGASHGFKAPNLKQTVPGARAEGPNTVIGNPALAPESADGVEIGVGFERGRRQWQLTAFSQRVRDLIELRLVSAGSVPGTGTYVYENLSRARLQGLELSGSEPLARGLTLGVSVSTLDAQGNGGQPLERRPDVSGALRLDAQQGRWRAGWSLEVSGRQWLPAATVGAPSQRVPGFTLQSAYASVDLRAGLSLQIGVRNLGDVRLADRSALYTQVEMPRTWRLALRGQW